ncbi:MAG: alginate lyase family protein [Anaerolineales bacterium]|nr:alginate lyase family protein [Anaerolineales bacterium]
MLNKIRTLASLYRDLGLHWSAFRLAYAFRLRMGLIRLQMPQYKWGDRPLATWLKKNIPSQPEAYAKWRKQNSPKFFFDLSHVMLSDSEVSRTTGVETLRYRSHRPDVFSGGNHGHVTWNSHLAIDEAERILNGEIKYFAHEFHQIGFPPNWHKDYFTNHVTLRGSERSLSSQIETLRSQQPLSQSDINKHWSQISDDSATDIKFIWEPNRFSFVYTLVRAYAVTQDEKYAEAFWKSILDWAEHNPPNTGANWMDGQEIALRLMAWTFGYHQFSRSPSSTPQRLAQFTQFVAAQAERIYNNIDYAISTRSNHTISEAFGVWMVGLLFPELKDSEKYLKLGRDLLEREASAQIFPDGSYSMYSLNYHRFVLHIYLYALRLGELNQSPISSLVYSVAAKSINYLYQLIDPQTGQMPVCGSNDGALVLPLNNCDFTDYRPLLQLGAMITNGKRLFDSGAWDEDLYWLCGSQSLQGEVDSSKQINQNFSNGGVYVLRGAQSKAVIRCTDYQARPSHADQLHVDLWFQDNNIACDAGTYLYSGEGNWRNGLAHTAAHNTVIVDSKDQMKMASRFTWTNWAQGKVLQNKPNLWQGQHDGYKPVTHKRTVMMLNDDRWLIVDHLHAKQSHHYSLHWLLNDSGVQELATAQGLILSPLDSKLSDSRIKMQVGMVEGNSTFSIVRADPNSTRGWRSQFYGHKEPAISVMLETDQPQVVFWTFFGFEDDVVVLNRDVLQINSLEINLKTIDDRPSTIHRRSSIVS